MNNASDDHHFLPVFCLRRWQGPDGLVEFARRGNGKIEGRTCFPKSTGYRPGLYSIQLHPDPVKAAALETEFMQALDRQAAAALERMEKDSDPPWTPVQRTNWSRFILSLMQRVPEEVKIFKKTFTDVINKVNSHDEERYKKLRWDGLPETLAEFLDQRKVLAEAGSLKTLRRLIDHPGLGQVINNMVWTNLHTPDASREFLTSDRPVLQSATLGEDKSDIDTAVVDSLKALDPERPIREATVGRACRQVRFVP